MKESSRFKLLRTLFPQSRVCGEPLLLIVTESIFVMRDSRSGSSGRGYESLGGNFFCCQKKIIYLRVYQALDSITFKLEIKREKRDTMSFVRERISALNQQIANQSTHRTTDA